MRVLFLHGWQNHREPEHWQSRVGALLRDRGVDVVHPQLPDPDTPDPRAWTHAIRVALGELPPGPRLVVCHSLSCLSWAGLAPELDPSQRPERVCWVAPPGPEEARAYAAITAFLPDAIDAEAVRGTSTEHPLRLVCSDGDPYCAAGADVAYGEPLGLDTEKLSGQGHLNPDSGYGDWPTMVDFCLDPAVRFLRSTT